MPSAASVKSEFWVDTFSEIELTLDELDDDVLDVIEQQIVAFKTWQASHPKKHSKGPVAYELLSQIIDE
jgi:hypothetical protein